LIVVIEEALLCIEEADVVGSAALPHTQWNVGFIAVVEHSLQAG
jgi:hypothetical protein